MSFHHGRTTRGAAALVTAFAAAAFVVQMAMPSAFAAVVDARNIDLSPNTHTYDSGSTSTTTATVTDVGGVGINGVVVTFTEAGPGAITTADGDSSTPGVQVTTTGSGATLGTAVVTTQTAADQVGDETITGTIDPTITSCGEVGGTCTNTVTATWAIPIGAARFLDLSPATATNPTGTIHIVTATVTDIDGNPVPGETVTFTEDGIGFFVPGSDTAPLTDANGQAQAFTTTVAGQTGGDETITADITNGDTNDCALLADDPTTGDAAGNCTADATKTWSDVPVTTPHARTISLRLSDGLTAKGTVTVTDGFTACAASVPVRLQRNVSGHWKTLKTKTTSATGAYHAHLQNRHGHYRAFAPKVTMSPDVCTKATSPTRKH